LVGEDMGCCVSVAGKPVGSPTAPKHINIGFNEETNEYDEEEYEPPKKQKVSVALWIDAFNSHLNNGTLDLVSNANGPLASGSFSAAPTNLSMTSSAVTTILGGGGGAAVGGQRSHEFTAVGTVVVPASRKLSNNTSTGDIPPTTGDATLAAQLQQQRQQQHRESGGSGGAGAIAAQVLSASTIGANLLAAAATEYVRTQFGALAVVNPQRPMPQPTVVVGEAGSMSSSANRVSYHSSNAATRGAGGTSRASTPRNVNPLVAGSWRTGDDDDDVEDDGDLYGTGGGGQRVGGPVKSPLFGNVGGLPRSPRAEYLEGASLRGSLGAYSQRSNTTTNLLAVDEMLRLRTVRPTSSNPASGVAGGPCVELDRRREELEDFGDEEYEQEGWKPKGSLNDDEEEEEASDEIQENPTKEKTKKSDEESPKKISSSDEAVTPTRKSCSEDDDDEDEEDEVTRKWGKQLQKGKGDAGVEVAVATNHNNKKKTQPSSRRWETQASF
ncbi:Hypothetical protein, putative, partial [Bodo saltans]